MKRMFHLMISVIGRVEKIQAIAKKDGFWKHYGRSRECFSLFFHYLYLVIVNTIPAKPQSNLSSANDLDFSFKDPSCLSLR